MKASDSPRSTCDFAESSGTAGGVFRKKEEGERMNSDKTKLEGIISKLISTKKENDYYDFKRQWYDKTEKLVHDIICMANVITHEGDRYIIIGIDNNYEVIGIENNSNRKDQQKVITVLKNYDFNGDYRPDIEVETIILSEKQVDVIIIKDKPYKPYFLRKMPQNSKEILPSIYTRIGDTNTSIDSSADYNLIEKMFLERFELSKTPLERMKQYLLDYENWDEIHYVDDKNVTQYYYKKFPEFTVRYWNETYESVKWTEKDCRGNPFSEHDIEFLYYMTILIRDSVYVSKDARLYFMLPQFSKSFYHNNIPYFVYYDFTDSIMTSARNFINKLYGNISIGDHICEINSYKFIEFDTKEEQRLFYSCDNQEKVFNLFLKNHSKEIHKNISTPENDAILKEFRAFIFEYYQEWKNTHHNRENNKVLND